MVSPNLETSSAPARYLLRPRHNPDHARAERLCPAAGKVAFCLAQRILKLV